MVSQTIKTLPKPHKISLVALIIIVFILTISMLFSADASRHATSQVLQPGIKYPVDLVIDETTVRSSNVESAPSTSETISYQVKSGDNLAKIFKHVGLSASDTYHVSRAGKDAKKLLKMMPGEFLNFTFDERGKINTLIYEYSETETLIITRKSDDDYTSTIATADVYSKPTFAQGEIESSFWNAGIKAGMTDNKIMELADIFGWDIDFAMEIRAGDTFNVMYEERYVNGDFIGFGDILAAEFVNQGEVFQAIRHTDGSYYAPNGRSMKKSFLRAPVNFRYISSNFTKKRYHPVQKRWKAHRGTDYAAPTGTPVVAAGKGRVIKSTYDKFNGHHVFIQHGDRYVTKYLHFSKRKVKNGEIVKQGQVIGLLGSTGMSSGPHLHYEFLVDGVHRNPRTVTLPKAEPIDKNEKNAFMQLTEQRLVLLNNNKRIMLASIN